MREEIEDLEGGEGAAERPLGEARPPAHRSPLDQLRHSFTLLDARRFRDTHWLLDRLRRFNAWLMGRQSRHHSRAEALRAAHPDLDDDALAELIIRKAARKAAWIGGGAGAAISGAELLAANLPGGLPFGGALLITMAELMWLERLQSAMIFSLAGVRGYSLDHRHLSDLGVLYGSMLQVKGATRVAAYSRTLAIKIFRTIGIRFSHRAALKFAVPLISIGAGAAVNYYMTLKLGRRASARFGHAGRRERWLDEIGEHPEGAQRLILAMMMLMAGADGARKLHRRERDLLTRALDRYSDDPEIRQAVLTGLDMPEPALLDRLKKTGGAALHTLVLELMVLMATADGKVNPAEEALLFKVAEACGVPLALSELTAQASAVRAELEEESGEDDR